MSTRPSHHDQHLARMDSQNEHRLRLRAERALELEAERENHIRARERAVERERLITPLLPTVPQHEFATPIVDADRRPVGRMDLPGERGEEFGGVIY